MHGPCQGRRSEVRGLRPEEGVVQSWRGIVKPGMFQEGVVLGGKGREPVGERPGGHG